MTGSSSVYALLLLCQLDKGVAIFEATGQGLLVRLCTPIHRSRSSIFKYCWHSKCVCQVVARRHCKADGCGTHANFNFDGEIALFCRGHASEGMVRHHCLNFLPACTFRAAGCVLRMSQVNVNGKRCAAAGCMLRPAYNFPGQKSGVYCMEHREEGMVSCCCCCLEAQAPCGCQL